MKLEQLRATLAANQNTGQRSADSSSRPTFLKTAVVLFALTATAIIVGQGRADTPDEQEDPLFQRL